MMEQVCLPVLSELGTEVAARLPDPQPEQLSTQAQLQTGSPQGHAHSLFHPGCRVLQGTAEATAMLPGTCGEPQSATMPPNQSRHRGSPAACIRPIPSAS